MTTSANHDLVSVVITFLDSGRFLTEAIESVRAQTYSNWELLLVDDGSSDESTHIAQRYVRLLPGRVRYLEHEGHANRGISASRNLGIRHARGEYVALLDSDDVWLPAKLERQVSLLQAHPSAGMVFGASQYWHSWHESPSAEDWVPDLGVPENQIFPPHELLVRLYPLGQGTAPGPSDLLLRRASIERSGGFQEHFRGLFEDQAFLARVYLREPVYVSGETWTRYRIHAQSCMATANRAGSAAAARLFYLEYLERLLLSRDVTDPLAWECLARALREHGRSLTPEVAVRGDLRPLIWQLRVTRGNDASLRFPPGEATVSVDIAKADTTQPWDIQMNQPNLVLEAQTSYRLTLDARADAPRAIGVGVAMAHEPWSNLGLYRQVELDADWRPLQFEFVAQAHDRNARLHIDAGGAAISFVVRNVRLSRAGNGTPVDPDLVIAGHYPPARWHDAERDPAARTAGTPDISVVIPTYQRRELVLDTVRALARQQFSGTFEVIVVVDGSTDGSADALRALALPIDLCVLEHSNQGLSVTRNRGAAVARGGILLFLDDDMEAHPRLLQEHLRSHAGGADAVLGHIPLHPESPANFLSEAVGAWARTRAARLLESGAEPFLHDLVFGQASIKRSVYEHLSGFDPDFTRGGSFGDEDLDLGQRLLAGGYRIEFSPYALSYQKYIVTPRHHLKQVRESGRADVLLARKHPSRAATIFSYHLPGRLVPSAVWRGCAALRPLTSPLMAGLRWCVLALIERGHGTASPRLAQLFFEAYEMEYWKGVGDAGGMPDIDSVRVLCYHAIRPLSPGKVTEPYGVPPGRFRRQLHWLKRLGFVFITGTEFLEFLEGKRRLPGGALLVTFDDCYTDLLDVGLPVLEELKIPAVAFAVTRRLGASNLWDRSLDADQIPLLDADGLRTLASRGISIGSHSRTHPNLATLEGTALEQEVAGSADDLERERLERPRLLAYPHGESNPLVRHAVQSAGYAAAFTVARGAVHAGSDRYLLPRIEILSADKGWKFLTKVLMTA